MADATYQPKVYRKQGGDELIVASGGTIQIESGGNFYPHMRVRTSDEDTYTLTESMSGLVYVGTKSSATQVISLPVPTTAGLVFTFVCGHASGEINVDPGAATYTIKITGVAVAATKDLKNTAASNVLGDSVTLVSDGVSNWWGIAVQGIWAST